MYRAHLGCRWFAGKGQNVSQFIEVLQRYEIPDIPNLDLPTEDGEPLESN